MRLVVASAFFVLAAAGTFAFAGCGSSSDNGGGGGGGDGGATDGTSHADTGNPQGDAQAGACTSIAGSKTITVTAAVYGTPNTPSVGAKCRISTQDGAGCLDVKADNNGTCTFQVDPAKGPFDVTVGNSDTNLTVQAITVAGVTDSIPGTVLQGNLSATAAFKNVGITGSIANLGAGNKLQIDAWDFQTVVTPVQGGGGDAGADAGATVTAFTSQYNYSPAVHTKIGLSAIEVDGTGKVVRGYLTPLQDRTGAAMNVPIDMSQGQAPTDTTIKIQWPSSGMVTGTTIKQVDPSVVQDQHIGNCIIEKTTPDELGAAMFVGVGNVDMPANGQSLVHLQVFSGSMAPDIAEALLTTVANGGNPTPQDAIVKVLPHDLTNNATLTVGQVNALGVGLVDPDAGSTGLDNVGAVADASGYDVVTIDVFDGKTGTILWRTYAKGTSLKGRGLPYLPAGVSLLDIGGANVQTAITVSIIKYAPGVTRQPWEAIGQDSLVEVNAYGAQVDPSGR